MARSDAAVAAAVAAAGVERAEQQQRPPLVRRELAHRGAQRGQPRVRLARGLAIVGGRLVLCGVEAELAQAASADADRLVAHDGREPRGGRLGSDPFAVAYGDLERARERLRGVVVAQRVAAARHAGTVPSINSGASAPRNSTAPAAAMLSGRFVVGEGASPLAAPFTSRRAWWASRDFGRATGRDPRSRPGAANSGRATVGAARARAVSGDDVGSAMPGHGGLGVRISADP